MIDILRKTLLAGFGAAVVTKETIESTLHDWIAKGKITPAEARGYAEKLVATGEKHWEILKDDVAIKASEILLKADVARQKEVEAMGAHIAELEVRLNALADSLHSADEPDAADTAAEAPPAA